MLNLFLKLNSYLDRLIAFLNQSIAAIGISLGVTLAFGNVVGRYIFDQSYSWAAELTTYFFVWSTFFGAAYGFKTKSHIAVTVLLEKIPPKLAKFFIILSHLIALIFLSAVSYYGYEYLPLVQELEEMSIDLNIPMWIPYLAIPVAFLFAAYRVLQNLVIAIVTPAEELQPKNEAEELIDEFKKELKQ